MREAGFHRRLDIAVKTAEQLAARARWTRNQLVNAVHGALTAYDLPDLAGMLGQKLTIELPADPMGQAAKAK